MHPLSTFFAQFTLSSAKLYNALIPWSLAVLVLAFAFEFYHGMNLRRCLMFLVKLFVIVLLTAKSHELLNASQSVVEHFLSHTGLVRPESVAQTYKDRLAATLGQPDIKDESVFWMIFTGHFLDALIYCLLLAASYVSLFIVTIITYVQKIALLLCFSVVPILFACVAVEPLAHLGRAHVMRILAIYCWPIGFAIAATFTDALINMALQEWVLSQDSQVQTVAAATEDLLILAAVGIWDVISTLAAPAFIHRFLVGHGGPLRLAPEWLSRTASYSISY
jgi:type IV secretion system protein TrbL